MKSSLYHLQLNIDFAHLSFYKELMTLLGWQPIFENEYVSGFTSGANGDLWFANGEKKVVNDYDNLGLNHIGIKVDRLHDVDEVVSFIEQHNLTPLFETPRHRPEFSAGDDQTYYQVMFKTADNILFEVVYVGKK
ncbi:MAG TPA: hypothetical protein VD999_06840 [Vitreimonas sp.]|nr:hypothetical protein [Vitreimonas sp.]